MVMPSQKPAGARHAAQRTPGLDRISARQLYDGVHERMALRWVSGMRGESRVLEPGAAQARRPGQAQKYTSGT